MSLLNDERTDKLLMRLKLDLPCTTRTWIGIGKKIGSGLLERNRPSICLETKMGNHGKPFSGRAAVEFEPTFYRMQRIRLENFLTSRYRQAVLPLARFFASSCPDEKLRVQQESKVHRNWKLSFYNMRRTYRGNSCCVQNLHEISQLKVLHYKYYVPKTDAYVILYSRLQGPIKHLLQPRPLWYWSTNLCPVYTHSKDTTFFVDELFTGLLVARRLSTKTLYDNCQRCKPDPRVGMGWCGLDWSGLG
jgi:hypothetical protein